MRLKRGAPGTAPMRAKFLNEHTHGEDEVRFFIEGAGAFYLRDEKNGVPDGLQCGRLAVGAGFGRATGSIWAPIRPFTAIRLFTNPDGWVAQFTGRHHCRAHPDF